ncbi:hypothetical protein Plec18167_007912 [Paecilomyces lecythidis]|uniref:HNH nuclease domain-containing protein n=1 Tax=Paecilomyces lecythidis TaxID=3004212 RepID=A0ABR3X0M4_9EURO
MVHTRHSRRWPSIAHRAKERINRYEPSADGSTPLEGNEKPRMADQKLKSCMVALLDWLPEDGRDSAAREILECETDDMLYDLFENIRTCLLAPLKAAGSNSAFRTPIEREESIDLVDSTLGGPQKREDQFWEDILRRDNHRCVITKSLDWQKWEEMGEPEDLDSDYIEAAHIIPFSLASWKAVPGDTYNVSQFWEALYRYFPAVRRVIRPETINDRSNGFCLRDDILKAFGSFGIAFVPTVRRISILYAKSATY